jgi:hypothetical protein
VDDVIIDTIVNDDNDEEAEAAGVDSFIWEDVTNFLGQR